MAKKTMAEVEESLQKANKVIEIMKENEMVPDNELIEKLAQMELENQRLKDEIIVAQAAQSNVSTESMQTFETQDDSQSVSDWLKTKVPFKAFKDDNKYKDDFTVIHNGRFYQIQRGITVMIPREVLFTIEDAEVQRANAANTSQEFENLYTEKQDKF